MKKFGMMAVVFLAAASMASAMIAPDSADYVIKAPSDGSGNLHDFKDLPHGSYYFWGVKFDMAPDEEIVSAEIVFHDIWNWKYNEKGNVLQISLFDSATDPNVKGLFGRKSWNKYVKALDASSDGAFIKGTDNEAPGDKFDIEGGVDVENWSDLKGGYNGAYAIDLTCTIPATHFDWLADGDFGIALDPDCHYYNNGVEVRISTRQTTNHVPDGGATLGLMGAALAGLAVLRRRVLR